MRECPIKLALPGVVIHGQGAGSFVLTVTTGFRTGRARLPAFRVCGAKLPAHFGPRDGGGGILNVFSPPPIQFRPLFVGQPKFSLALGLRQTVPKRHGQFGPVAGRELEELRQRT